MGDYQCAVTMCDNDGDVLVPCCENGHRLHRACLRSFTHVSCPLCRSRSIEMIATTAAVLPSNLIGTSVSTLAAAVALYVGRDFATQAQ